MMDLPANSSWREYVKLWPRILTKNNDIKLKEEEKENVHVDEENNIPIARNNLKVYVDPHENKSETESSVEDSFFARTLNKIRRKKHRRKQKIEEAVPFTFDAENQQSQDKTNCQRYSPKENLLLDMTDGKRLSLAYKGIREMPDSLVAQYGPVVEEIDLTYNKISDFRFLTNFPKLTHITLDHNGIKSHVKFPEMEQMQLLWVNHNKITNLSVFISMVAKNLPNLRFLSMMNNEAAPSYFNGGSFQQYLDYRYYVISHLPQLQVLDDQPVSPEQRSEAERIYGKYNYSASSSFDSIASKKSKAKSRKKSSEAQHKDNPKVQAEDKTHKH